VAEADFTALGFGVQTWTGTRNCASSPYPRQAQGCQQKSEL